MWKRTRKRNTQRLVKAHVLIDEEKGSDVNLASYLLYDTLKNGCRSALVISNDTDLCEPIRMCVQEGSDVRICNPGGNPAGGLRNVSSSTVLLDKSTLPAHQLATPLKTRNGKTLYRPSQWS